MRKWLLLLRALFFPNFTLNKPLAEITNDIYKADEKTSLRVKKKLQHILVICHSRILPFEVPFLETNHKPKLYSSRIS